ncbi:MAG: hypothetical protein ACPGID_03200 [Rubricella sp.]
MIVDRLGVKHGPRMTARDRLEDRAPVYARQEEITNRHGSLP